MLLFESADSGLHCFEKKIGIVEVVFFSSQTCFCLGELRLSTGNGFLCSLNILLNRTHS